jgi:bifunctional ADP-heptose synthase (sugar kinase/adenylyltransferase)
MTPDRFQEIASTYAGLRVAVVGDFCLDRYLEIDPARAETSIETGLPVYNVVNVRAQPGGAGTIVNNLVALGVGTILPVSFRGDDGEGYELERGLSRLPGLKLDHFLTAPDRRTFTYCKPLLVEPGKPPVELNRLDSKNWTRTPPELEARLAEGLRAVAAEADAIIVLEQVDAPETGIVTRGLLEVLGEVAEARPALPILADSRQGLRGWPPVSFKMNAAELGALLGRAGDHELEDVKTAASELAGTHGRPVFVTLSERGIVAAGPGPGIAAEHVPALPLRGPIDIVGAGDSVTANLATALAAGASLGEAIAIASIASSHVIHQLGTTGTAGVADIAALLDQMPRM